MALSCQRSILTLRGRCNDRGLQVNQLIVITAAVFCAVVLAVQAGAWLFAERKGAVQAINRRLTLAQQNESAKEVFEALRRERGLAALESPRWTKLNELLTQTGLRLNGTKLLLFAFAVSLGLFFLFGAIIGFGFLAFLLGVICSPFCLLLVAMWIRRKRIGRFGEQLPDALDVIVRGIKAGYPFVVALNLVSKEMPDPIGSEFGLTCDEITFGSDTAIALKNLHTRVGEDELNYLTMAVKVQTETGGNLAEVLGRLSKLMRDRAMLRLKVRSLSAEGRLSGVFLSLAPVLLFGIISLLKHDYYTGVSDDPLFTPLVVLGIILLLMGNLTIYKMVNFKV